MLGRFSGSDDGERPSGRRARVRSLIGAAVAVSALGYLCVGEMSRLAYPGGDGPLAYFLGFAEVMAQVRVSAGALLLALLPLLLFLRTWKSLAITAGVCAACLWPALALRLGEPAADVGAAARGQITVALGNVLWTNANKDGVLDALANGEPDLIAMTEVSTAWREAAIARFEADYPYVAEAIDRDEWGPEAWGQMLFSKFPVTEFNAAPVIVDGVRIRPVLSSRIEAHGRRIAVQLVHPQRPGRPWRFRGRYQQLNALSDWKAAPGEARILLGDLNTTGSSPRFRQLAGATGLVDTRQGFGRQPTWYLFRASWPSWLPDGLSPGIALDHVLVSPDIGTAARELFELPGSDHSGVHVTLQLAVE